MADFLISAVLDNLVAPAIEQVIEEVMLVKNVSTDIESLVKELKKIKLLLEDAEKKQIHDESVKDWLDELKGIAYDLDDVLDEWNTRILLQNSDSTSGSTSSTSKNTKSNVFACFSFPCHRSGSPSQSVVVRYQIAHRIKDLRLQLDKNAKTIPGLHLIASQATSHHHEDTASGRIITSSFVDPLKIHGRDQEKETIMNWLRSDNSQQEAKVSVMSIVGTPGFGKTALAQLVFHQEKNSRYTFDPIMWACVSEPVDLRRLAQEIIESSTREKPSVDGLEAMLWHLSDSVKGKTFLLFLDDVWPENLEHWWEQLKSSLNSGAQGSKIIITTRYQNVADLVESTYTILLGELPHEDCWSLFERIAFSRKSPNHHNYKGIGEEIVKKCKGVPLAIKTIAGVMQDKQTINEWESVRDSDVWEFVGEDLSPILLLSYRAFPSHLKQCFMYCAVIAKDTVIEKEKLVKLWMAQGFLGSDGGKELELIGGAYFDDLAKRSFFQDFTNDTYGESIVSCKMHDLVHDFAQSLTRKECCVIEMNGKETCSSKVRHLAAACDTEIPSISKAMKNLRTLITSSIEDSTGVCKWFRQLTCLRTLDLSESKLKELPKEVELLLHLRYLDLSWSNLTELPETLCKLCNLQTLNLYFSIILCKLPTKIGELSNLRHFENSGLSDEVNFPKGIGRLSHLRTLGVYVVSGASGGCSIGELGSLDHLGGDLKIKGLSQVGDENEAKLARLDKKKNLDSLELEFFTVFENFTSAVSEKNIKRMEGVLQGLQPHDNLKELSILGYPGFKLNLKIMQGIRRLSLGRCGNMKALPVLGELEFLIHLKIWGLDKMKQVSAELLKSSGSGVTGNSSTSSSVLFPRLKTLELSGLREWAEEEDEKIEEETSRYSSTTSIMPCLVQLTITFCPKLKVVPHYMFSQSLKRLKFDSCPGLSEMQPCLPLQLEVLMLSGDVGVLSSSLMPVIHNNNTTYPNLKSFTISLLRISSLPQGLDQFTSLQKLRLSCCELLDFKPEEEFRHLHTFPTLTINNCPLLKERHHRDNWDNLSNFPKIIFEY